MQRYFIELLKEEMNSRFFITGDVTHHISRVMRMKPSDELICCSKDGYTAKCVIEKISSEQVECTVLEWLENSNELPVEVVVASGLPKGDKLELIIQKGTELGASAFIPFNAARSVVKLDEKKAAKKRARWEKIAKEAAEQSHRNQIPAVHSPLSFKQMIQRANSADVKIVAYEEVAKAGEMSNLQKALCATKRDQTIFVVFGPEGGLTEEEIHQLKEVGFITCGLGPRILRTETAPLYLLSAVSYQFELMR
ncbi:16S rRNA (uracil(1498)-N(3))-methyltransferase [Bacillus sp. FJAT-47783]|uniref:16S rRNA (uracil(1498)-N(3))-methyltransferase n=1 Tax=Bacillus sp. FJAT-47783 TaxID=2922712 RepID=UPI001FAD6CC0|nr:16S rRNA (uracil(1498)-N(3))-methyltransferase [Bacillus sp. FJAT-47783]